MKAMHITNHARKLVHELLALMPSPYQSASLKAMLVLFLSAQGIALPEHTVHKSPSALSRFLNFYRWPTRSLIRTMRRAALRTLLKRRQGGRRPYLRAIVDLTPLQKSGRFEGLSGLVHVLNKKRGLQVVVLYLEVEGWRVPWGFRLWRGKDSAPPSQLALKLLRTLPRVLTARHRVMVLADSGFCSTEFIEGVRRLGHHAVVGVRRDRHLSDGTRLDRAATYGKAVYLEGLAEVPVYVASYLLKRRDGTKEKRFVVSTKALSVERILAWGRKRWAIEGFFKVSKGRFSLERFGQGSKLGVYRYLLLSLLSYLLAHWGYLSQEREGLPRWDKAARKVLEAVLPQALIENLLMEIEERSDLLQSHGIEIRIRRGKL